jgi:HEAT repeat protein
MPSALQTATGTNEGETPGEKHEAYVTARIAELMDLGMDDQRSSLDTILSELNNRDPRIREAAVEAAIQFGSRDAIPVLIDAAAQTDDTKEKAALLDAAEFLKLPTLSEVTAQKNQSQPAQTNGVH